MANGVELLLVSSGGCRAPDAALATGAATGAHIRSEGLAKSLGIGGAQIDLVVHAVKSKATVWSAALPSRSSIWVTTDVLAIVVGEGVSTTGA